MDAFQYAAEKLDLPKILHRIQFYASSDLGKEAAENLEPCSDLETISTELNRISEMKSLLEGEDSFPIDGIKDIRNALHRASVENSILTSTDLLAIASTVRAAKNIKLYLQKRSEYLHELYLLSHLISIHNEIEFNIYQAVEDDGTIKDSASKELKSIRQEISQKQQLISKALQKILRATSELGMVREEIVTTRDGRMVIPIKAELKNKFPGFIHSASATGQTVYIEPSETLTLNNSIMELHFREQREIERILRNLTEQVHAVADQLKKNVIALREIDLIYAKAQYSIEIKGNKPLVKENGSLIIRNGFHPILLMRHQTELVIPLSIELGTNYNTLLVSGPNAGGKTVVLKTIGLLSLMIRYGIHIPTSPDSEIPIFNGIYVLIGDNQSIENDLSTYSSQIFLLKEILQTVGQNSLVLIDEIGSNTDPTEGGAIAASVLEHLTKLGALTVSTTHQTALKAFVHNSVGMENGAMEFDQESLLPTYRLKVGLPGSSYALEIASRLGIDENILSRAKSLLGEKTNRLESLLLELENRSQQLDSQLRKSNEKSSVLRELANSYEKKIKVLNTEIKEIKKKAIEEARAIVEQASSQIERTIKEIRTEQAAKDTIIKAKSTVKELQKHIEKIETELFTEEELKNENKILNIAIDDVVILKSAGQAGVVLSLPDKNGNLYVGFNSIKAKINIKDIQSVSKKKIIQSSLTSYNEINKDIFTEVDVRGLYGDDAIQVVDKFLDSAILSGLHKVDIIHGKGTGALRKKITSFLTSDKRVKNYRLGEWNEGGTGVTVVELS